MGSASIYPCRSICIFGSGGEHLHTIPGKGEGVAVLLWLNATVLAAAAGPAMYTWVVSDTSCVPAQTYISSTSAKISFARCSPDGKCLAAASSNSAVRASMGRRASLLRGVLRTESLPSQCTRLDGRGLMHHHAPCAWRRASA